MATAQASLTATEAGAIPRYSMVLEWDAEDRIFVVGVPELPGCNSHGSTYEEAARKGAEAISAWVEVLRDSGLPVPQPRAWRP